MGEDKKITNFQDLNAWQASRKLFFIVFKITKKFPKEEVYSSVSQMRRAAMSVASNLAEGFGRSSKADKLHFYVMARGSLTELQNQLILTADVELTTVQDLRVALDQAEITHKLIVGLTKATEKRA
ncbi:MAG: four helix bundle protein [Candidatus Saccharimonadales bacterium]